MKRTLLFVLAAACGNPTYAVERRSSASTVTREINDGLLAPRFSPSQRAWVLSGTRVEVRPPAPASTGRDGDDR
jgi:hypothetical protein